MNLLSNYCFVRLAFVLSAFFVSTCVFTLLYSQEISADIGEESHLGFIQWYQNEDQRGPKWITRNLIDGNPIVVCSVDFPMATSTALERWNAALGINAFVMSSTCDDIDRRQSGGWDPQAGVVSLTVSRGIWTDSDEDAFRGKIFRDVRCRGLACAGFDVMREQTQANEEWQTYHGRAEIIVVPSRPADGDNSELLRDITHELGHVLALADYFCFDSNDDANVSRIRSHPDRLDPPNRTIINSLPDVSGCNSLDGYPTQLDKDDYRTAYWPAIVTSLAAKADRQTVTLTWNQDGVFVESHFEIQRLTSTGWVEVATAAANETTTELAGQPPGERQYRVVSRTHALPVDMVVAPPPGPTSAVVVVTVHPFVAPVVTSFTLVGSELLGTFGWQGTSPRELKWELRRDDREDGDYDTVVATKTDSSSPVEFNEPEGGYWYQLRGRACETQSDVATRGDDRQTRQGPPQLVEACGDPAYSDPVWIGFQACEATRERSERTNPCVPEIPSGLTSSARTSAGFTVGWGKAIGAASYQVRLDENDDTIETANEEAGERTHVLSGLNASQAYDVQVRSVRGNLTSDWSDAIELYTLLPAPTIDTDGVIVTSGSVTLAWNEVVGADGYDVKRTGDPHEYSLSGQSNTSRLFDTLEASSLYTFSVRAKLSTNDTITSVWRQHSETTLARPTLALTIASATTTWRQCVKGVDRVPVDWSAEGGEPPYATNGVTVDADTVTLLCPSTATPGTLRLVVSDSGSPAREARADVSVTPVDALLVSASADPRSCELYGETEIVWSVSGGVAPYEVRVDGTLQSDTRTAAQTSNRRTSVECDQVGARSVSVSASDARRPSGPPVVGTATFTVTGCAALPSDDSGDIAAGERKRWVTAPSGTWEYEEAHALRQAQVRSAIRQANSCGWVWGVWRNEGAPYLDPNGSWKATGATRCKGARPSQPSETRTESVSESRWVLIKTTAERQVRTGTAHYSRTVTWNGPPECAWEEPDWGEPDRIDWNDWVGTGANVPRPTDEQLDSLGDGTETQWVVGSTSACEQIEQLERRRTRTVSFSSTSGWVEGPWSNWSAPYRVGWSNTGTCLSRPDDLNYSIPPQFVTETEWRTEYVPPFFECVRYEVSRTNRVDRSYTVTYSWGGESWVSQVEETVTTTYGNWRRTGNTGACGSARSDGATNLTGGDYVLSWESQRITFSVPAGATVQLSGRALDGGGHAAVLTVNGGAELVIRADALSGTTEERTARFAGTTDATLSAIAASLRAAPEPAAPPSETATRTCAEIVVGSSVGTTIDLGSLGCAVVRGGGQVTVQIEGISQMLGLAGGRDWLLTDASGTGQAGTVAASFIDLSSGGYLILSLADGAELARHVPEGEEELGTMFDGMSGTG